MYLVVWTERVYEGGGYTRLSDHFTLHETFAEAKADYDAYAPDKKYQNLCICVPIVGNLPHGDEFATPRDCMLHVTRFEGE